MADAEDWVRDTLGQSVVARSPVQALWSGYGEITRLTLSKNETVILKRVAAPASTHPRGWDGERSHARKLHSYGVEHRFYTEFADRCAPGCRVPRALGARTTAHEFWLLLEDVDAAGYGGRRSTLNDDELYACLDWLACFHGHFVGTAPAGLWPVGAYWHLDTRPDEFDAMADGPLREAAREIDTRLSAARFQTLVHGDAKVANFCFGAEEVAALDFQYVGGGCGMKDLAYFLGSCMNERALRRRAAAAVERYFATLRASVPDGTDRDALEREWRKLYPLAWADFHRFLAGWSPGHRKLHGYAEEMSNLALKSLANRDATTEYPP